MMSVSTYELFKMLKLNFVIFQDNLQAHSDQLQKFSSWHIQVSIMFEMKYVLYIDIEIEFWR